MTKQERYKKKGGVYALLMKALEEMKKDGIFGGIDVKMMDRAMETYSDLCSNISQLQIEDLLLLEISTDYWEEQIKEIYQFKPFVGMMVACIFAAQDECKTSEKILLNYLIGCYRNDLRYFPYFRRILIMYAYNGYYTDKDLEATWQAGSELEQQLTLRFILDYIESRRTHDRSAQIFDMLKELYPVATREERAAIKETERKIGDASRPKIVNNNYITGSNVFPGNVHDPIFQNDTKHE